MLKSIPVSRRNSEMLYQLAEKVHDRKPDAFTAKMLLLTRNNSAQQNITLLQDSLKRFPQDRGIRKIAVEYFLANDLAEADREIIRYKKDFASHASDMARYEIVSAAVRKDFAQVSRLFRQNFTPQILPEYWNFAINTQRITDLQFLSRAPLYRDFCHAAIMVIKGQKQQACDLLEKADAQGNLPLLFFAAKILGENRRTAAALKKYAQFPANSPYKLAILLNTSELHAEAGNLPKSLSVARQAWQLAPEAPETQLCYAEKLFRTGHRYEIPDVIRKWQGSAYEKQLKKLWIPGMETRIRNTAAAASPRRLEELCTALLRADSSNAVALEYLKKLQKKTVVQ